LRRYPGLRLVPSGSMTLRVEGTLRFCAHGKKTAVIEDGYEIRIDAPETFPERMALAWETAARIPPDYHKLTNAALCLQTHASPTAYQSDCPNSDDDSVSPLVQHTQAAGKS
jgi:hypothetical protein